MSTSSQTFWHFCNTMFKKVYQWGLPLKVHFGFRRLCRFRSLRVVLSWQPEAILLRTAIWWLKVEDNRKQTRVGERWEETGKGEPSCRAEKILCGATDFKMEKLLNLNLRYCYAKRFAKYHYWLSSGRLHEALVHENKHSCNCWGSGISCGWGFL